MDEAWTLYREASTETRDAPNPDEFMLDPGRHVDAWEGLLYKLQSTPLLGLRMRDAMLTDAFGKYMTYMADLTRKK